jgi:cytochrome b pre-mRNA-processing protein 3
MLNWFKERQSRTRTARDLYGSIVAQARQPAFYAEMGVPDVARGRFELIALHTALVMHRLQRAGDPWTSLARSLAEVFVTDMDDNMRELTFSDLAVPREVKKVAAALYDRHAALAKHPDGSASADALQAALAKDLAYLSPAGGGSLRSDLLAHYLRRTGAALASQDVARICDAGPDWLNPMELKGEPA